MPSMTPNASNRLPRWKGFNLLEMFGEKSTGDFVEDDFRWIAGWGFDFVRIPMHYRLLFGGEHMAEPRADMFGRLDHAVNLGDKYGLHVCLNFHTAPGYRVSLAPAPGYNLWKDAAPAELFCRHWEVMTRRYLGISSDRLSFNPVNEPPIPDATHMPEQAPMSREDHKRVIGRAVAAIRRLDADRLIIADGVAGGAWACPELAALGVAQSCRAYTPFAISHYRATWGTQPDPPPPPPVWPGVYERWDKARPWDRRRLEEHYAPWGELVRQGVGVHCGEGGAFNRTPHAVFLGWYRDCLEIMKGYGIGHALWNFRGSMGIIDSGRSDAAYADWHGHKLDRKLLDLLRET